jgi:MFS family permease
VIADLMRGTGHYNLAQGLVATVQGIGASISGLVAGVIVDHAGYRTVFLTLGSAAAVAFTVFATAMPETAPGRVPNAAASRRRRRTWSEVRRPT